jgi:lipid-binding SYLF domain-containing protein
MKYAIGLLCFFMGAALICGCKTAPETHAQKKTLSAEVEEAIAVIKAKDPDIQRFFDDSYGYAVLPKIVKGAFVVGAAHGMGEVYEQKQLIGYTTMTQISGGISFGGEYYREYIFFKDKMDLDKFKQGEYTFAAQMMAIAARSGVAAKADYKGGMAVFILADTGLMADASLGGQKFRFAPYDPNAPVNYDPNAPAAR